MTAGSIERRKRTRVPLHWTVYLGRPSSEEKVRAETLNLSSEGFYCMSPVPFTAGETIDCTIVLPVPEGVHEPRRLAGRTVVLRVEPNGNQFGIACRLEDYSLDALC